MGFAVLHINKASGNDAAMSTHIERTVEPKNADKTRSHLNRELLTFPDGIFNRTDAIQRRIETAGITRKIGKNQVRAIRVMLTGTHDDMKQLETDGKLSDWCNDNLKWLKETFGAENLVSAVLHRDEKTPHIHATIVPIVTGERRKARKESETTKKKYRKKTCYCRPPVCRRRDDTRKTETVSGQLRRSNGEVQTSTGHRRFRSPTHFDSTVLQRIICSKRKFEGRKRCFTGTESRQTKGSQ
jgi:hypothetical protein